MTRHTAPRIPQPHTASYRASAHLSVSGPLTTAQLFAAVDFGSKRVSTLDSALRTGWLIEVRGKIDISDDARAHFIDSEIHESVKAVGQVAAMRHTQSVYERPNLKYKTNSRGDHARVIDDRFQRTEGTRFHSVPTGDRS